ncbi:MAG: DNA mismatch endonuclease Vsr [Mesorhizobium sp.]|uniref:very short patch repair endonuclease n=1 Tax=Mesorhizobium sp. TaxID=1871066 RepID=UPI001223BFF3|nr:very short patch repair endonuclease [Mesorhizobium sp.]TIS58447.1 MAG: DNA mismatch endonuclease Vsr [Mesorhizobium sp.]
MTDIVNKETRSRMMAGIRGKDTKPETVLRHALHARGFRYRLHARHFPGRPDVLFPKFGAAIFVHGCFWHRHEGCRYTTTPATRPEFWQSKFAANVARDEAAHTALLGIHWRVATVWECALRRGDQVEAVAELLAGWLRSEVVQFEVGEDNGKCRDHEGSAPGHRHTRLVHKASI